MLPMSVKRTDRNPSMDGAENMNHWLCTLRAPGGRTMRITFSMGLGHHGAEPTIEDVLNCCALDASGLHNGLGSFKDWCSEYGFDTDSRKAMRTFRTVKRQAEKLEKFLTPEQFEQLLWHTERL